MWAAIEDTAQVSDKTAAAVQEPGLHQGGRTQQILLEELQRRSGSGVVIPSTGCLWCLTRQELKSGCSHTVVQSARVHREAPS